MTDRLTEIKARLDKANVFAPFEEWEIVGTNECHYAGCVGDFQTIRCDDACQAEVDIRGVFTEEADDGAYLALHPRVAEMIVASPSDIAWLIAELEKANDAATKAYEWFYGAGTTEQEQAMCDAFFKWKGGPYTGNETKQIETVTEYRCGTETVYTDGTKDFQWSE